MGNVDTKPLISVIVPVYKVEEYLHACVDSILGQTYTNLEIILVDDGSPDDCPAICDEYARIDSRVKVIHKENGGLSDARNAGMAVMNGEYLMFVDSDDCLTADAVEVLLTHAQQSGALLVIGCHQRFSDDTEQIQQPKTMDVRRLSKRQAMEDMLKNGCASWARLYHYSVHKDIVFPKEEINEDEAIVLKIIDRCDVAILTNQIVYQYRCRPESITTSSFSPKKFVWYRHCRDNLEWIREHYPELTEPAAARYRGALLWTLTEIALSDKVYPAEQQDMLTELRDKRELFFRIPFDTMNEKIRFMMLCYLPFSLYRLFIRRKRSI